MLDIQIYSLERKLSLLNKNQNLLLEQKLESHREKKKFNWKDLVEELKRAALVADRLERVVNFKSSAGVGGGCHVCNTNIFGIRTCKLADLLFCFSKREAPFTVQFKKCASPSFFLFVF